MRTSTPLRPNAAGWRRLRLAVRDAYRRGGVNVPVLGAAHSAERIWRAMVIQVVVIGSAEAGKTMSAGWSSTGLGFRDLSHLLARPGGRQRVAARIQRVFADYGVRYVRQVKRPSGKALAVARNLEVVQALGGPRRFVDLVRLIPSDEGRVLFLRIALSQVGKKSSRDLAMTLGLIKGAIALDARIEGLLRSAGILRRGRVAARDYEVVEREILKRIARPLGMSGMAVDRTMFQRRKEIEAALGGAGRLA